jgi:DNA-binding GntR family transcriptional regulator
VARTAPPKVREAADTVREMIGDGKLLPGETAPSAPGLSAQTGICYSYCARALRALVADGTLEPGKPPRGRPRVPRG